jgi:hypothetical protein
LKGRGSSGKLGSLREEGTRKEQKHYRIFESGRHEDEQKTRILERGRDKEGAEN